MARIWEKLAEPQVCLVIGHLDADGDVVAMALAEPGRAEHGAGAVIPDYGHVSMVFFHPDRWGRGLGGWCLSSRSAVGLVAGCWSQFGFDDLKGEGLEFGD